MKKFRRIAVIGAGAAGAMAAIWAARAGAHVTLLERTRDGGRKILISGGGRCNVLPARVDESRFVTESSPRTLHNILRAWPLREQIRFFEQDLGIALTEEAESAKLFPASNRARDVRDALLRVGAIAGVTFASSTVVRRIAPHGDRWSVEADGREPLAVDAVIVATGGRSVPATGSDGIGLTIAAELGHAVHPTYPALTPVTARPAPFASLAGVSLPVTITARDGDRRASATGGFLFTHDGYSGPAVLDVSHIVVRSHAAHPAELRVQWTRLSEGEWNNLLTPSGAERVGSVLRRSLPERLAIALAQHARVDPSLSLAQLHREDRLRLIEMLVRGVLPWSGHEGYRKAEVTGGGVDLDEIDPGTMESRRHKGLFLCGEMLDAFGPIGGYNFLWAWVTGRLAGVGAAAA